MPANGKESKRSDKRARRLPVLILVTAKPSSYLCSCAQRCGPAQARKRTSMGRRLLAALAGASMAVTPVTVDASTPHSMTPRASMAVAPGADDVIARAHVTAARLGAAADAIRADLDSGSLERVVRRMATMAGVTALDLTPTVSPALSLSDPITGLLEAATASARLVAEAAAADDGGTRRLSRRAQAMSLETIDQLQRQQPLPRGLQALREDVAASPMLRAAEHRGRGAVRGLRSHGGRLLRDRERRVMIFAGRLPNEFFHHPREGSRHEHEELHAF